MLVVPVGISIWPAVDREWGDAIVRNPLIKGFNRMQGDPIGKSESLLPKGCRLGAAPAKIYAVIRPEEIRVCFRQLCPADRKRHGCRCGERSGAPGALVALHLPPVKLWLIPATEATYNMEISK
jgi:hypothetical protein